MAQVKLNLQPPPNVDFVTGYPGIPPGPNRPQASVRGAIEVRVPPAGVKAKWVRIELRKVETLPGGGPGNTYYDYVGPSPVNLWSTADEYGHLRSQDFPFSIRIPESIPPTIALDNRAGISYELLASVCTKGKRGFLRKAKSVVVSTTAPVIIDKHELHSTWPVYCQAEQRHISQDEINLIVERNRTCFGPGDRISVVATVKSDSLHTVILRGFEILLRETTIFRPGIAPGRKAAPLANQVAVAENQVAVNATLYGGTSHNSELACMVPANHTTPTLTSARHLDVTYTLSVKALMGSGLHIILELPIVMSNWQREVSFEAINRIGPTHGLSLLPQNSTNVGGNRVDPTRGRTVDVVADALPVTRVQPEQGANTFNTAPTSKVSADEFGTVQRNLSQNSGNTPNRSNDAGPATPSLTMPKTTSTGGTTPFTVANPQDTSKDIRRNPSTGATTATTGGTTIDSYLKAEEEKVRLYELARDRAARIQGAIVHNPNVSGNLNTTPNVQQISNSPPIKTSTSQQNSQWLTAGEEKLRLFVKAQEAAARTHGTSITSPPPNRPSTPEAQISPKPSAAATLYAEALNSRSMSVSQAGGSSTMSPVRTNPASYLTAAQEKAALKRYEDAKRAVDKTQNTYPEPIAYESLFPANFSSQRPPQDTEDGPPSFDNAVAGPSNIIAQLSEKERIRKEYEARDNAALALQKSTPPPATYDIPPPAAFPSTPAQYANAQEEKEAMRKKLEARDAARTNGTTQPPPRLDGVREAEEKLSLRKTPTLTLPGSRPTPVPPASVLGNTRVLSAAEEKALLKAKFDGYDVNRKLNSQLTNGVPHSPLPASASSPPPLMPRPPAEYIKETQEEDARLSRLNGVLDDATPGLKLNGASPSTPYSPGPVA